MIKSRFLARGDYPRLSTCVLNPIISNSCKREAERFHTRETERERDVKTGKAWNDATTNQGILENASNHWKLKEAKNKFSPRA